MFRSIRNGVPLSKKLTILFLAESRPNNNRSFVPLPFYKYQCHYSKYSTNEYGSMKRLQDKIAIITASTEGIGFEIARRLGSEGAHVVVSSRNESKVALAVEKLESIGISVLGTTCHISREEDRKNLVSKTIQKFGGIDILVSNAGVNPVIGGILQCSEKVWDKIFEINVKNAVQITQLVVPHMQKRGGGSIVYVSSITGFQPFPLLGPYSLSKTTLLGLTKVLAHEVALDNIRVNSVAPGIIETKFSMPLYASEETHKLAVEPTLLKRLGKSDEVSGVVAFLCSSDSSYITGENIVVAGGMQSRL